MFQYLHGGARDIVVKGIAEAGAHEEHTFAERAGCRIGHGEIACPQGRHYARHGNPESGAGVFLAKRSEFTAEAQRSQRDAGEDGVVLGLRTGQEWPTVRLDEINNHQQSIVNQKTMEILLASKFATFSRHGLKLALAAEHPRPFLPA